MSARARQRAGTWLLAVLALLAGIGHGTASAQLDAAGDGSLRPPTAPRYSDPAWYDLLDVRLLEGDPIRISVTLAAVDGSGGLPIGITQPIIEVYLDTEPGGAEALLPGSGLSMPLGEGWQLAFRITGDGAWGWQADPQGGVDLAAPVPIEVVVDGRDLTLLTPFRRPQEPPRVYAISGVYDPFRPDGWRPLTRDASAWAFSSPSQVVPVVDVFPSDLEQRAAALARGELPRQVTRGPGDLGTWSWIVLMVTGFVVALAGVVLRVRSLPSRHRPATAVASETPAETDVATPETEAADTQAAAAGPELIADVDLPPALVASEQSGIQPEAADAGDETTDDVADEAAHEAADDAAALDQGDEDAPAPADGTESEAPDEEATPDSSQTSAPSDASRGAKRS